MRRLLSILLLLVLGIGPTVAAVPANALDAGLVEALRAGFSNHRDEARAESQLPACCRRNGKHHCALAAQAALSGLSRQTTISTNECCPCAPQAIESTAPSFAALLRATGTAKAFRSELRSPSSLPAAALIADLRTQPKRGPPLTQFA